MRKLLLALLIVSSFAVTAQEKKEEPKYGINFSGFVRNDVIFNTRQNASARNENLFQLAPLPVVKDFEGNDLNAVPNLNIIGISTRLKGTISAPDAFGAKTSGVIEADFFGKDAATSFALTLRHAFMKLNWEKGTELLVGQTWHPAFSTDCFPGSVSYSTGTPFTAFSRNPQLRLTKTIGKLSIQASTLSQGNFKSIVATPKYANGKDVGIFGTNAQMNAIIPEMSLQIQYTNKKEEGTSIYAGAGFLYKMLKPLTVVDADTNTTTTEAKVKYLTKTKVSGMSAYAYAKIACKKITAKVYGMYGQMNDNMVMMGGYAIQLDTTAILTNGERYDFSYTPYNTISGWLDIHTNGKKVEIGVFAGYNKNLGVKDNFVIKSSVGRWTNVASMLRVAPRIVFKSGKMNFGFEFEYSQANYASQGFESDGTTLLEDIGGINKNGVVTHFDPAKNLKALFSATYNF
jgi:hypothetical protein